LLLIVVVAIIIATFDWNRLKPTINQKVSTELNRPFAIRGDLGVWERQKEEPGWRSWIPGRTSTPTTSFSATRRISRTSPWSTCRALKPRWRRSRLTKTVYLPWIKLQQPDARLIRLSEKNNNWTFNLASDGEKDPNAQPSSWSFSTIFFRSRADRHRR
jgi:uncharacterized protein involved in outer membrane biogenesis